MICNIGPRDRIFRLMLAAILMALSGEFGPLYLALSGYFAVTGFVRWCPLYLPFRVLTK